MPKQQNTESNVINLNTHLRKKGQPIYEGKPNSTRNQPEALRKSRADRVKNWISSNKIDIAAGVAILGIVSGAIVEISSSSNAGEGKNKYEIPSATGHKLYRTLSQGEQHGKTVLATVDGMAGYIHFKNPEISRTDAQIFIEAENAQDQAQAGIAEDKIEPDTLQPRQQVRFPMEFGVGEVVNPDLPNS
jgi:hypothetical protein